MSQKSGIDPSVISLPKGGGALHGIGEKFSADLHSGTGNFSVPLWTPPGRSGLTPSLSLQYSSGAGNGNFGLGWSLSVPGVSRKTSKGVPRYDDDRDTFVLSGAEDLVALAPTSTSPPHATRYRPRTEGLFARIHHHLGGDDDYWNVETGDGLVSLYGTPGTRGADPGAVRDPADPRRVFAWKLTETRDPFGNVIQYEYQRAQPAPGAPVRGDQLYLSEVRYADYGDPANPSFLIRVRFVYDERPDAFSEHRAGFEVRTTLRCTRVEVSTHADRARRVRTTHLDYLDQLGRPEHELPLNKVSLLSRMRVVGRDDERPAAWGPAASEMPPLELGYTRYEPWSNEKYLPITGAEVPPGSLGRADFELADLFGRGLPDVFQMAAGALPRYWKNLGGGRFDYARTLQRAPVGLSLAEGGVQLLDANGDGRPDLVVTRSGAAGYFPFSAEGGWDRRAFQPYRAAPTINLEDPSVRLLDLTGDGVTDALRTGEQLECFFQDARGWSEVRPLRRRPLDVFPNVDFRDPRVKIADMTGDGLSDIVLVHSGAVEYWPNLGHGDWGPRVSMTGGPTLPPHYDPRRLLVGDLDGDGVADLAYVDFGQVTLWINQSGNSWSEPIVLRGTPPISDLDALRLVDLLGAGTLGILWTYDRGTKLDSTYKFLDPTHGVKPYLLDQVRNNMGATTSVEYAPSTRFRLADEDDPQTRWKTTLPFPVQVVAKVVVEEAFSENRLTTEYAYRHGYWDGEEREFRGFGRVDQRDTEVVRGENASPPVETRTWFHLGAVGDDAQGCTEFDPSAEYWIGDPPAFDRVTESSAGLPGGGERGRPAALRSLRGRVLRSELYALDGSPRATRPYTITELLCGLREEEPRGTDDDRAGIFFPHVVAERVTQWERGSDPMSRLTFSADFDRYGRSGAIVALAVPRGRDWRRAATPVEPYLATLTTTVSCTRDDARRYMLDRISTSTSFEVINDGALDAFALSDQVLRGQVARRIIGETANFFDGEAFEGLPAGQIGDFGALVRAESLVLTSELLDSAYGAGAWPACLHSAAAPWPAEYPGDFRTRTSAFAGYSRRSPAADPAQVGYFTSTILRRYDFQTATRTPRGLLVASRDPLGHETSISYDPFAMLTVRVQGPTGLASMARNDYRVLLTSELEDANGNRTAVGFAPLGLVERVAVMGKAGEAAGDTLDTPGTLIQYELTAFERGQPLSATSLSRVHHANDATVPAAAQDETVRVTEFSDGLGRLLQTRSQAEDLVFGDPLLGDSGLSADQEAPVGAAVGRRRTPDEPERVVVSGWQTYDNKGRVVEKYEPLFDHGWDYRRPSASPLAPKATLVFDPRGEMVRTINPDSSEVRVVHGVPSRLTDPDDAVPTPWEAYVYDPNDNAGRTHPGSTAGMEHHWNTASNTEVDALGRVVRRTERLGLLPGDQLGARFSYDIRGNLISVTDPMGRIAISKSYDLANRVLRTERLDAGVSTTVFDAAGTAVEERDSRGAMRLQARDALLRPELLWARDSLDGRVTLRERIVYGDQEDPSSSLSANQMGRPVRHYDEAGVVLFPMYDFHGNALARIRRVIAGSHLAAVTTGQLFTVDWTAPPGVAERDHAETLLDLHEYRTDLVYDALGRVTRLEHPTDGEGDRKICVTKYSRASAVESVTLAGQPIIEHVAYNAKGQRTLVLHGNRVLTRYAYDPRTFRLARLRSEHVISDGSIHRPAGSVLQDIAYDYDLSGNIVALHDRAPGSGTSDDRSRLDRVFTHDALYRLLSATGRECGQASTAAPWDDSVRCEDPTRSRRYAESYVYDLAGNLTELHHRAEAGSFRRNLTPVPGSNRLQLLEVAGTSYRYQHDSAGNMVREGESRHLAWDHSNRLRTFREQAGAGPAAQDGQYLYGATGERVVKFMRKGTVLQTTVYAGNSFEHHTLARGASLAQQNNYISVAGPSGLVALRRVGPALGGGPAPELTLYLNDHLGSANVSMDATGGWLSREEFAPFGETTFGGFARKRFRFTGKERDDESGFSDHGARYYAPWLARWTGCDPLELSSASLGSSPYTYVQNRPVVAVDPDGRLAWLVVIFIAGGGIMMSEGEEGKEAPSDLELALNTATFGISMGVGGAIGKLGQSAGAAIISKVAGPVAGRIGGAVTAGALGGGAAMSLQSVGSQATQDLMNRSLSSPETYANRAWSGWKTGAALGGAIGLAGGLMSEGGALLTRPRPAAVETPAAQTPQKALGRPTSSPTIRGAGAGTEEFQARWPGDPRAAVGVKASGGGVDVTDLYRGNQPSGSGGAMLADTLKSTGFARPSFIRLPNIVNPRTLAELEAGVAPGQTLLGKSVTNAVSELGGTITGWSQGTQGGKKWISANIGWP
ncbi:MAG: VCBS repeat-containing protein [Deltaproteobacteria bacterium]|nr:VCBS repeat-containing protein [Deltaproteobacteria bacterium]